MRAALSLIVKLFVPFAVSVAIWDTVLTTLVLSKKHEHLFWTQGASLALLVILFLGLSLLTVARSVVGFVFGFACFASATGIVFYLRGVS